MFGSLKLETIWIRHRAACLHTQQCVMSGMIVSMRVVGVVCGKKWSTNFTREFNQKWIGSLLICKSMILQFNKKVVFAKNILQSSSAIMGASDVALHQALQYVSAQTTTRRDQTFMMLVQQLPVNARLVVVTLQKCAA